MYVSILMPVKQLQIGFSQNAKDEKSIYIFFSHIENSKIAILGAHGINIKFFQQYEFLENLADFYGKCCWRETPCSSTSFSIQIFLHVLFLTIQIVTKSHS